MREDKKRERERERESSLLRYGLPMGLASTAVKYFARSIQVSRRILID